MEPPIIIRHSRRYLLLHQVTVLAFFAGFIPIAVLQSPELTWFVWMLASLGLVPLFFLLRILQKIKVLEPRLEISDDGFLAHRIGVGFVPWEDVKILIPWAHKNGAEGIRVFMEPAVTEQYLQECSPRRRFANRADAFFTGTKGLVLNTATYDRTQSEIYKLMLEKHLTAQVRANGAENPQDEVVHPQDAIIDLTTQDAVESSDL